MMIFTADMLKGEQMDKLLKRCPFCGGKARLWVWSEGGGVCVKCIICGCQTPTHSDNALLKHMDSAVVRAMEEWNRRESKTE